MILGLGAVLFFYLNNFSPYRSDGSLDSVIILVAFSLLAVFVFFVLQAFLSLFCRHQSANQLAFMGSFVIIQIILINSWNFVNLSSVLTIAFFNLFLFWYAIKVL